MQPGRQSGELNGPDSDLDGAFYPSEERPRLGGRGWLLLGKVGILCGRPVRICRSGEGLFGGLACRRSTSWLPTPRWPPESYAAGTGRIASWSLGFGMLCERILPHSVRFASPRAAQVVVFSKVCEHPWVSRAAYYAAALAAGDAPSTGVRKFSDTRIGATIERTASSQPGGRHGIAWGESANPRAAGPPPSQSPAGRHMLSTASAWAPYVALPGLGMGGASFLGFADSPQATPCRPPGWDPETCVRELPDTCTSRLFAHSDVGCPES